MISRADRERRIDPETGEVFDSLAEMRRWHELKLLERAGEITVLQRQVPFGLWAGHGAPIMIRSDRYPNGRRCTYTVDFMYLESGETIYEDFKGFQTDIARFRIAVFEACYGVRVRITGPAKIRKPSKTLKKIGSLSLQAAKYGIGMTKSRR